MRRQHAGDEGAHVGVVLNHQHARVIGLHCRCGGFIVGWIRRPLQRLVDTGAVAGTARRPWRVRRDIDGAGGVRQPDCERAALVFAGLRGNRAVVQPDEFGHQRQPDPRAFVAAAGLAADAVKPLEHLGEVVGANTDSGVAHGERHMVGVVAQGDLDVPGQRVLDRVGQQVEDDLLPHADVDRKRSRQRFDVGAQRQPRAGDGGGEQTDQVPRGRCQVDGFTLGLPLARLDSCKVEEVVHQTAQPARISVNHFEPITLDGRQRVLAVVETVLGRPGDQGQRCAELVADVREELVLGPVQLGKCFGPAPLCLVGLSVDDRAPDLRGGHVEEPAKIVVQAPVRRNPGHHHGGGKVVAAGLYRQDQRGGGWQVTHQVGAGFHGFAPRWGHRVQNR